MALGEKEFEKVWKSKLQSLRQGWGLFFAPGRQLLHGVSPGMVPFRMQICPDLPYLKQGGRVTPYMQAVNPRMSAALSHGSDLGADCLLR